MDLTPTKLDVVAEASAVEPSLASQLKSEPFDIISIRPTVVRLYSLPASEVAKLWPGIEAAHRRAIDVSRQRTRYTRAFAPAVTQVLREDAGLKAGDPRPVGMRTLEEAIASFDRGKAAADRTAANATRLSLIEQFPAASWPNLALERYSLGLQDKTTFCYRMEFGSQELGSIRGGSAHKLIIYRQSDGSWYYPSAYADERVAWQAVRHGFVEMLASAEAGDVLHADEIPALRSAAAFRTKVLHLYYPDLVLPVYSSQHLLRFLELLGQSKAGLEVVAANRAVLRALRSITEIATWSTHDLGALLYHWADPRLVRQVIRLALRAEDHAWQDVVTDGYIAIGWDALGDLSEYASVGELDVRLQAARQLPDEQARLPFRATDAWTVRELQPGDIVVASSGTQHVAGIGKVVEPGYHWRYDRPTSRGRVQVEWIETHTVALDSPVPSWAGTVFSKVSQQLYARISRASTDSLRVEPSAIPIADDQRLLDIAGSLAARGQVLLYGPPGTGKTYHARRFAVWWLLREQGRTEEAASVLGDAVQLRTIERELTEGGLDGAGRLTFVTFHPSYTYEDFVEGYRPVSTANDASPGALTLAIRDGVFKRVCRAASASMDPYLLVIDEFNRGNVSKIMGELLTLLELDKRSVEVRLSYSGAAFSVPPNVFILATMNTADRSIRLLDAALRRRFRSIELLPDTEVLSGARVGELDLELFLAELNTRIRTEVGREKQLGHSFLLDTGGLPVATEAAFAEAFLWEILPILQEYAYDDYALLGRFLGDELVDCDAERLKTHEPDEIVRALARSFRTPLNVESD